MNVASRSPYETSNPDVASVACIKVGCVAPRRTRFPNPKGSLKTQKPSENSIRRFQTASQMPKNACVAEPHTLRHAASRSPHKTSNPDVGCVRNARTRFLFKRPQSRRRVVNCCPRSPLGLPEKVQAAFKAPKRLKSSLHIQSKQ